jgi:hypothetical protein
MTQSKVRDRRIRFDLSDEEVAEVDNLLENLDRSRYKSINAFVIEALKYYIAWCGGTDITKDGVKESAPGFDYIKKREFEKYCSEQDEKLTELKKNLKKEMHDEIMKDLFTMLFQGMSNVAGGNMGFPQMSEIQSRNSILQGDSMKNGDENGEEPLPNDQIMNLIAGWADGN